MYVTALVASGYRNLNGEYPLCSPLAVLVGENNAGKSNIIDALRILLEPEGGPRGRAWITADDFAHDGTGAVTATELELEVQLGELTEAQQARMVTCLAPSLGIGFARMRLRATLGADGRVLTQRLGGDGDDSEIEPYARDAIRFTYLHPLRDAAADLRPSRDNRLVRLLASLSPNGHPDRDAVEKVAEETSAALNQIDVIQAAKAEISHRLDKLTGSGRFRQQSDLAFSDPKFERVVGALRAKVGRLNPLEMAENGLGFNNLLYMAVILAALADQPEVDSRRVLLVEEPEAHLHPQLQDLLMRYFEEEAGSGTQVIVTSHSPNFASVARVERLTVIARASDDSHPVGRRPLDFGLTSKQLDHLRRFLDVTKAALFFARGVILVEGVAEQLLLPVIANRLGRPLAPSGVTVINIGGIAFSPFTDLFGPDKLPYRLATISDDDRQPDPEDLEGGEIRMSPRAQSLAEIAGENVYVALAPRTLEWAMAHAGNKEIMLRALEAVKPRVAVRLRTELAEAGLDDTADAILAAVGDVKGQYAQELADLIADPEVPFSTPEYLSEAIAWVADLRVDEA